MKIALLGYGKMGKTIEEIALNRKHEIVLRVSDGIDGYDLSKIDIDVAIDFSIPDAAYKNITTCFKHKIPVISGTTGWLERYDDVVAVCKEEDAAFIYASNFSIGVNVFFHLNAKLAKMMKGLPDYSVSLEEIHHTKKLDAPSGTAISLADQIISENTNYNAWELDHADKHEIPIYVKRISDVPGTHVVTYKSTVDTIEIMHTAHNRQGFALGAITAAEWIQDKKGIFSMDDVLSSLF